MAGDESLGMHNEMAVSKEDGLENPTQRLIAEQEDQMRASHQPLPVMVETGSQANDLADQIRQERILTLKGKMRRADVRRAEPGTPMTYKSSWYGAAHRRNLGRTTYLRYLLELESSSTTSGCGKDIRLLVPQGVALTLLWKEKAFPNVWFHRDGLSISIQTGQSHQAIIICRFTDRGVVVKEGQEFFTHRPCTGIVSGTMQVETRVLVNINTLAEIRKVLATVASGSGATIQLPHTAAPGSSEWVISITEQLTQVIAAFSVVVESVQAGKDDCDRMILYVPREHPESVLMCCGAFTLNEQRVALFPEKRNRDDAPTTPMMPILGPASRDGAWGEEENQRDRVDNSPDNPEVIPERSREFLSGSSSPTGGETDISAAVDNSLDPDTEYEDNGFVGSDSDRSDKSKQEFKRSSLVSTHMKQGGEPIPGRVHMRLMRQRAQLQVTEDFVTTNASREEASL